MTPRPQPIDGYPTATSHTQAETEEILLKHIPPSGSPEPLLQKNSHMQYLIRNFIQGFPSRYVGQDASQPWLMFWTLQSFSTLQVALDPRNKQRAIDKIMTWQHPEGGFSGGPGQSAHLLATYASICSLAIVGRPGQDGGWDLIDRQKMYKFFMSLKQKDGSFLVARHAEVDVRGIYCLLVVATLLDILTPELLENTAEFISSCQTYEGGFSSASHPSYSSSGELPSFTPRPPLGEAHGGYTFCCLASWVLLQPHLNYRRDQNKPAIDVKNLLRWLVHMQGIDIELGGFKGRTNKLVDGCYSWWCGGSFALLETLGVKSGFANEDKTDNDDVLFNRRALQNYVLLAGQYPAGGLCDKPPKKADAYHTHYCLSGLSMAQHHVFPSVVRSNQVEDSWKPSELPFDELRKRAFTLLFSWTENDDGSLIQGGQASKLNATHPLTNLTITHAESFAAYFYKQTVPQRQRRPATTKISSPK